MKILVTGGAGYIGSALVEKLNKLEIVEVVYVLDNLSSSHFGFFWGTKILKKIQFVKGDILDAYVLDKFIGKVDVIYHLAGYVSSPYNYTQNVQYEQINKWGTLNIVRAIQQSKNQLSKFIYLSSAAVYGLKGKVDPKRDEPQPTNAYGTSKLGGEKFVTLLKDTCDVKILRAGNVFGFRNNLRLDSVLNNFIFQGIVNNKILIYGDGSQERPFVSLDEVTDVLLNAVSGEEKKSVTLAIQFNASLNEIKDWLLVQHLPDLEYTFINTNVEYEGQHIDGNKALNEHLSMLNETYEKFKNNIRIEADNLI